MVVVVVTDAELVVVLEVGLVIWYFPEIRSGWYNKT